MLNFPIMFIHKTSTSRIKIFHHQLFNVLLIVMMTGSSLRAAVTSQSSNELNGRNYSMYEPVSTASTVMPSCASVRTVFQSRGIDRRDIPSDFLKNNIVLRYCEIPSSGSCCTSKMEKKLLDYARSNFEKHSKEPITKLWTILDTRAKKFDELFKNLLTASKLEFHSMFKRTYGTIYEQNAYVFADLFSELELYYTRGTVNLSETMDSFFNTLYQKLFTVLNSQYLFDDKYMGCVGEHMKDLKPFGDIPNKLSIQIKRSFVATRTYAQALKTGAEVVKVMTNIRTTAECASALTKMQGCGKCNGYSEKPCASYCVNVMKGCLQHLIELDAEWEDFITSMEKISSRLLGPFNVVMVLEPINIKISEAIMNFQEKGFEITSQVFQGCGKPVLGNLKRLNKRSVDNLNATIVNKTVVTAPKVTRGKHKRRTSDPANSHNHRGYNRQHTPNENHRKRTKNNKVNKKQNNKDGCKHHSNKDKDPPLDGLVIDVCQKLREHKKFYANLPYKACLNDENPASEDSNCWNGHTVDKYAFAVVTAHETNPELTSKLSNRQNSAISQLLFKFKNAIGNLKNSYNGLDVEWPDQEEPFIGSGSGAGSSEEEEPETIEHTFEKDIQITLNPSVFIHTTHSIEKNMKNYSSRPVFTSSTENIRKHQPDASGEDEDYTNNEIDGTHHASSNISSGSKLSMSIQKALILYFMFPIYVKWIADAF